MILQNCCSPEARRLQLRTRAAFTLVEIMVASGILLVLLAGVITFVNATAVSLSGITAQTGLIQQAGNSIAFIQDRVRLATRITSDASGNVLTISFDDDPKVDSNADGKLYNDQDHFERFTFSGVNSTNVAACSNNKLIYIPNYVTNVAPANTRIMIPKGVRNLPGSKIFSITNQTIAIIRLGIVDTYERNHYQAIDLQGTAVSLNRPAATNFVAILP